ncbi:hypothetical protein ACP4OV_012311 [Aristida adscensionis]
MRTCQRLVEFDPNKRWSPLQASYHPFINGEASTGPYEPVLETPRIEDRNSHIVKFTDIWNAFVISLREEDLLSNRDLLIVPSSGGDYSSGLRSFFASMWYQILAVTAERLAGLVGYDG